MNPEQARAAKARAEQDIAARADQRLYDGMLLARDEKIIALADAYLAAVTALGAVGDLVYDDNMHGRWMCRACHMTIRRVGHSETFPHTPECWWLRVQGVLGAALVDESSP